MNKYLKIFLLLNVFLILGIILNIDIVNAESYYLVKVNKDGTRVNLNKMTNDLNNAINEMNNVPTDLNSMPSIAKDSINGTIINTKYGLVKISGYQYAYESITGNDTRTYINTNGNRDYDGAFLGQMASDRIYTRISALDTYVSIHLNDVAESGYSEIIPLSRVTSPSYYEVKNGELIHYYTRDLTPVNANGGIYASNILGKAPVGLTNGKYYSYDGIYFYRELTTMLDDYKNKKYSNAVNSAKPFYNYYQYLPYRTKSNITAVDLDNYLAAKNLSTSVINGKGKAFTDAGNTNTVNSSILYAIALHESQNGTSTIAKTKNNIFGLRVYDSNVGAGTTYNNVESCINEAAKFVLSLGYADASGDARYFGAMLGNKGSGVNVKYASDPYWGEIVAARYYDLDKKVGFKDYNKEVIGIKTTNMDINLRKTPYTTSQLVYKMCCNKANKSVYNMSVTIVEDVEGEKINGNNIWYKIRSDTILDSNKNTIDLFKNLNILYNYNDPYIYVHSSYISKANQGMGCMHTYNSWTVSKEPTCTEDGIKERMCLVCFEVQKEKIDKLDHAYDEWKIVKDSTCSEKGEKVYTCTRCKEEKKEEIPLKEHKYGEYTVIKEPTCIEEGIKEATCLVGHEKITEKIPALGHKYTKWIVVKQATENEKGKKESICDVCKQKITVDIPELKNYTLVDGLQHLEKFQYNNTTKKLEIVGFIAMYGVDNKSTKEYNIEFVNEKNNESIYMPLLPKTNSIPFEVPSQGGKNLKYSWYEASLDLSTLPEGNYTANIIALQDNLKVKKVLSNMFSKSITKKATQGQRGYTFTTNYFSKNIPIEISIRDNGLMSFKEPPSDTSMFNTIYNIDFVDNKLKIVGTSFNVGADYSKNVDVKRQFIFENVDTFERYIVDGKYIDNGPYKITLVVPDGLDKTRAWFSEMIDLSILPKGRYTLNVRTYTNNVDDNSELNDIFDKNLSSKKLNYKDKDFSLEINSNKKYRLEIIVK